MGAPGAGRGCAVAPGPHCGGGKGAMKEPIWGAWGVAVRRMLA